MLTDGDAPLAPAIQTSALPGALAVRDAYVFHDPWVLGTYLNLVVRAGGQDEAYAAAGRARAEIERLNAIFNWRDAGSEISQLNRAASHVASADLFAVTAAAERWRDISLGAYSGRLGRLLDIWREAGSALPAVGQLAQLAAEIAAARVELDPRSRTIVRPDVVRFDFDGIAKGYIVDRALDAAMQGEGVTGAMVDIGGDIRCAGAGPHDGAWRIGVPQPLVTYDNAPLCGVYEMKSGAVATSGFGPRDGRIGGTELSATLDPRSGWPVAHRRSATAAATTAMDADALATAMLVLGADEARDCIDRQAGMSARVTRPDGVDCLSGPERAKQPQWIDYEPQTPPDAGAGEAKTLWDEGWVADVTFNAPPKDMRQAIALRSPYVAIWISDMDNKPVRTLILIGSVKEWQSTNHVWWRLHRGQTEKLLNGRSMSTRGSGTYRVYWFGIDDEDRPMPPGRYRLNVETSREKGGHQLRTLDLDMSQKRKFEVELPMTGESGGLLLEFRKIG